jgi:predicted MFS family arabinose efflux permease
MDKDLRAHLWRISAWSFAQVGMSRGVQRTVFALGLGGLPRKLPSSAREVDCVWGPFRHRTFSAYWVAGLLSNTGTWLQTVAASVFIYQVTGSTLMVGIFNFASYLPVLAFSVPAGILSDRVDRRKIVAVTHLVGGLLAAGLAILTIAGLSTTFHVIAFGAGISSAYAFAKPALASIIPSLVPRRDLEEAVALNSLQFTGGQFLGSSLAAVLLAAWGPGAAFAINALTFLGPITSMAYLRRQGVGNLSRPVDARGLPDAGSAKTYLRRHRWVLYLLVAVFGTSSVSEVMRTLAPAYAVEHLRISLSSTGVIMAAQGVGSAIGLGVFLVIRRQLRPSRNATFGLTLQAIGLVSVAVANDVTTAAVGMGLVGLGHATANAVLATTLQASIDDAMRGRVMSYHTIANLGTRPIVALAAGGLAAGGLGPIGTLVVALMLVPAGLLATHLAWRDSSGRGDDELGVEILARRDAPRGADSSTGTRSQPTARNEPSPNPPAHPD